MLLLAALFPVSLLPERTWAYPCRALALLTARPWVAHYRRLHAYLPPELPRQAGLSPNTFVLRQEARFLEEYVQVLRGWTWRWRPDLQVRGRSHVDAALERGAGAILWVAGFEASDLVVKMALAESGYGVAHVSRPTHGFSASRFGVRFLNPLKKRVEDRCLRGRIVIEGESAVGALREARRRLAMNQVVSITVGDAAAATFAVPLLGGTLAVATGPAGLALRTGAALLPVFSHRERSGTRTVTVGAPLNAASVETVLVRFAAALEGAVLAHPDPWTGWRTGSFSAST
jgi:lauroyl/myristoyl acyltransferase